MNQFFSKFRKTDLVIPLAVMAVLIVLVVIVAVFFHHSQIHRVKGDVYSYVFEDRVINSDLTFKSTEDGILVRENGREYGTEGYAYYYAARSAMITSDYFCYYDVDGFIGGKVPCFTDLEYEDGRIHLSARDKQGVRGGFFHNGRDSYILAEPGWAEVNGETYPLGTFSNVFCYRGKTVTIYNYGDKEAVYLEIDPEEGAFLKLESGLSVDLRYDIYYLANGVKNLLIASPEALDEIDLPAMEGTDEE